MDGDPALAQTIIMTEATASISASSRSLTLGRIVRNVADLGSSQVLTLISSSMVALVLPRFLGADHLGKFALASAFTTYFLLATNLGVTTHLTKELARDPDRAAAYTMNSVYLRLPLAVFAALAGVALINVIGADGLTKKTIYIMSFGMVLTTLYDIFLASLQGLQVMRPIAISQVIVKVSFGVTASALLIAGYGLLEVALVSTASVGLGLVIPAAAFFTRVRARGANAAHIRPDPTIWKTLILGGLPFLVWQASLVVYGKIDMLMLGAFTTDQVLGWYAAAYRLTSLHTFIPAIVMTATLPALVAARRSDPGSFNQITRRALQVVIIGSLPIAGGTLLLADKFIEFFAYPDEFSHSVPLVIILALHSPFVAADMIIGTALIALDKQRQWAFTGLAAAVLNPAMNMILIPLTDSWYQNGAIGAAAATTATELFMMTIGLWLLPRGTLGLQTLTMVTRAGAALVAMAIVVTLLRDAVIFVPVLAGAVVYCTCLFAFRAMRIEDVNSVLSHLGVRARFSPAGFTEGLWRRVARKR
jgi:O-antigen/teichoic acid export membrane protein